MPYFPKPTMSRDDRHATLMKILQRAIERDERIALLERVIYECVSYRDINNSAVLTEELYNEILYKFEPDLEEIVKQARNKHGGK